MQREKQRSYRLRNKEKIKQSWKNYYSNNQDKIKAKRKTTKCKDQKHQSYLRCKDHVYKQHLIYRIKNPWIYAYMLIKNRSKLSNDAFLINREQFYIWFKTTEKKCYYCDLENIDLCNQFYNKKAKRFTIDRKNNNKGYTLKNICFACPVCNLLKNSFFSDKEWKEIAQKFIKPKWKKVLK